MKSYTGTVSREDGHQSDLDEVVMPATQKFNDWAKDKEVKDES